MKSIEFPVFFDSLFLWGLFLGGRCGWGVPRSWNATSAGLEGVPPQDWWTCSGYNFTDDLATASFERFTAKPFVVQNQTTFGTGELRRKTQPPPHCRAPLPRPPTCTVPGAGAGAAGLPSGRKRVTPVSQASPFMSLRGKVRLVFRGSGKVGGAHLRCVGSATLLTSCESKE